ncbi:hypothetical protein ACVIGB_003889 [Bradyrhizobium sp. USDA 4341]|uniref:Uncharacterized protein n=1 Tax=Bradyrhizobium erythrophlei TaxID=1437360 RepID=A0A1H4X7G1_9BRAD|nr:hypothetical protein SAMN05444164_3386 [Bradyrhizobium erythrophlei]
MANLIVAVSPSRLSRYSIARGTVKLNAALVIAPFTHSVR